MSLLLNVALVLLPSAAIVFRTARTDRRAGRTAPAAVRSAAAGYVAVLPVALLLIAGTSVATRIGAVAGSVVQSFILAGLLEESAKLAAVAVVTRGEKTLLRMYDGLRYAALVGLGFAFVENLFYVSEALPVVLLRSITALPIHISCAAIAGYAFAGFRLEGRSGVLVGLVTAALFHGLYDLLLQQSPPLLLLALFPLAGAAATALVLARRTQRIDRNAGR